MKNNFKEILEKPEYEKTLQTNPLFEKICNVLVDATIPNKDEIVIQSISNLCEMISIQQRQIIKYMIKYGNCENSTEDVERWSGLKW